ncbi:MAG: MFS transporter [Prevotella sp.]|nr:MFS transporter [Prevotella sp.]
MDNHEHNATGGQTTQPRLWNRNYTRAWTANFMLYVSFMLIVPILPLYLNDTYGAGKHTIGAVLSGYTIAIMLVRPFSGYLIDSFNRHKVLLLFYSLAFLMCGMYLISTSLLMFTIVRTLHGAPYGATIIANSTVAIDVLHPERRAEGIGYYGLSNNLATALSPSLGIFIYEMTGNFQLLFVISMAVAGIGMFIASKIEIRQREPLRREKLSLDRFFLLAGWRQAVIICCFGLSYGILSTYLAIYGKEQLGISSGTGIYFMILSVGLILSRIQGGRALRDGRVTHNAAIGVVISVIGYTLFAAVTDMWAYYASAFIIGLGNGHMFPAIQTMFINLAPNNKRGTANSTLYSSWDAGVGIGILAGGIVAESMGYSLAFWAGAIANMLGVVFFFTNVRKSYEACKLR